MQNYPVCKGLMSYRKQQSVLQRHKKKIKFASLWAYSANDIDNTFFFFQFSQKIGYDIQRRFA